MQHVINSITQSAVSQQIRALENKFQVTLVERGRRNFSLTAEGSHRADDRAEVARVGDAVESDDERSLAGVGRDLADPCDLVGGVGERLAPEAVDVGLDAADRFGLSPGALAAFDGIGGLPDDLISALETRAIWAKFGF